MLVDCGIGESGLLNDRLGSSSEFLKSSCRVSEGTDRIVPLVPFEVRILFGISLGASLLPFREFILLWEREVRVRIGADGICVGFLCLLITSGFGVG
jgi:hypothetical protein